MKKYVVVFHTKQIGQNSEQICGPGTSKEDALAYAKRRNQMLSKGEKSYYGMKYTVRQEK